jgi:hypothetical protein
MFPAVLSPAPAMPERAPSCLETVPAIAETIADALERVPSSVETVPKMVERAMKRSAPIATVLEGITRWAAEAVGLAPEKAAQPTLVSISTHGFRVST